MKRIETLVDAKESSFKRKSSDVKKALQSEVCHIINDKLSQHGKNIRTKSVEKSEEDKEGEEKEYIEEIRTKIIEKGGR